MGKTKEAPRVNTSCGVRLVINPEIKHRIIGVLEDYIRETLRYAVIVVTRSTPRGSLEDITCRVPARRIRVLNRGDSLQVTMNLPKRLLQRISEKLPSGEILVKCELMKLLLIGETEGKKVTIGEWNIRNIEYVLEPKENLTVNITYHVELPEKVAV